MFRNLCFLLLILAGLASLSCKSDVSESVVIQASPEVVWDYLSDNSKAQYWSVFFDHISSMPGDIPDGQVGALRRCFRNADETGMTWDEEGLITRPYTFRRLRTFNVQHSGYPGEANAEFWAEQEYVDLGNGKTRLTFRGVTLKPEGPFYRIMYWFLNFKVSQIFKHNLENIKAHIEQRESYKRPHPWVAD